MYVCDAPPHSFYFLVFYTIILLQGVRGSMMYMQEYIHRT